MIKQQALNALHKVIENFSKIVVFSFKLAKRFYFSMHPNAALSSMWIVILDSSRHWLFILCVAVQVIWFIHKWALQFTICFSRKKGINLHCNIKKHWNWLQAAEATLDLYCSSYKAISSEPLSICLLILIEDMRLNVWHE